MYVLHFMVTHLHSYANMQAQNRDDILQRFDFAVPVFHAYGHSAKCQVRQWSYSVYIHTHDLYVYVYMLCMYILMYLLKVAALILATQLTQIKLILCA